MAQKEIFNSAMKTSSRHCPMLNSQISLLWESLSSECQNLKKNPSLVTIIEFHIKFSL
jgi:Fic family protein